MRSELPSTPRQLLALTFAALGVCAVFLAGCSTVEGAGEDLEYVGDKISDTSRDAQD